MGFAKRKQLFEILGRSLVFKGSDFIPGLQKYET